MLSFRNMIYNQDTWKAIKTWNTASRNKYGTKCKWWVYRLIHCYQYTLQRLEALNLVEKKMATMAVAVPKQNCHWIWEMTSDKSTLLFQLNFSLLLQKVFLEPEIYLTMSNFISYIHFSQSSIKGKCYV